MKKAVSFRIDPELYAHACALASAENRSLTNFVETLMRNHIRAFASPSAGLAQTPQPPPRAAKRRAGASLAGRAKTNGRK